TLRLASIISVRKNFMFTLLFKKVRERGAPHLHDGLDTEHHPLVFREPGLQTEIRHGKDSVAFRSPSDGDALHAIGAEEGVLRPVIPECMHHVVSRQMSFIPGN